MPRSLAHWLRINGVVLAALLHAGFVAAQTLPGESESLTATIMQIKGAVQYRQSVDQPWALASVNLQLKEGAELRTLPDSAVQFTIPPDQTIVLDRVSKLKIVRASFKDGKVVTDLGMEYGRTRFDIEGGGREHDARIRSQNSTLAVRGTRVAL